MKIARVTGHVTATIKDAQLQGRKLLVVDIEDGRGAVIEQSVVAVDTCSAGPGDLVLVLVGSAARLPAAISGAAVDAAIVAVIDDVRLAEKPAGHASN